MDYNHFVLLCRMGRQNALAALAIYIIRCYHFASTDTYTSPMANVCILFENL